MAIDHFGKTIIVGSVVEIRRINFIKSVAGWHRKLARIRKHSRRGTVTAIAANSDLSYLGTDGATHIVPSRYVEKIS